MYHPRKHNTPFRFLLALVALFALSFAHAQTSINPSSWSTSFASMATDGDSVTFSGNTPNYTYEIAQVHFNEVSLTDINDSISVSLTYTGSTSRNFTKFFHMALLSKGTSAASWNAGSTGQSYVATGYSGYRISESNASNGSIQLNSRGPSGNDILAGGLTELDSSTEQGFSLSAGAPYDFKWTITRADAETLSISFSIKGGTVNRTYEKTVNATHTTFDTLVLGSWDYLNTDTNAGFTLSNVTLTTGAPQEEPLKKKIFAHYMGNFPIGYGGIDYYWRNQHGDMNPDSTDFTKANGGRFVNWPLLPPAPSGAENPLNSAQSAELEVRRAIRAGIDGFAVDAWSGGDSAKAVLSALFEAAERLDLPFELTIALDPSCHTQNPSLGNHIAAFTSTLDWLLRNHGNSPKLARRDGKVLIFGYSSDDIIYSSSFQNMAQGPDKWNLISDAYAQVRQNVLQNWGQELFLHFCFDNIGRLTQNNPTVRQSAAAWAGQHFDAVGGFLGNEGNWSAESVIIDAIKSGGAEWSQPVWHQYVHKSDNILVEPGLDKFLRHWRLARETDSTLLQYVTWNDYGEDTTLAPGYSTNYTLVTLNKHLADWWKQGAEPTVTTDSLHLVFRRHLGGASVFPFGVRNTMSDGLLEVVTLLTAPGAITLPGRAITYEAPAGLHTRQFPLVVGEVSAILSRDGAQVIALTTPERVTDRPFREDHAMVAFSSDFAEHWRADFGDTPPLLYSEYGDSDGDGLPNWFEMLWFGNFPDMTTATLANPWDDPDSDGLDNLTEYLAQTHPLKSEKTYAPGFVWNHADIHERGLSFNPDRDANRNAVWHYRYKLGERGSIAHDGDYIPMPSSSQDVSYAGKMAHFAPTSHPVYNGVDGWIARNKNANGTWQTIFRPKTRAAVVLTWRSPVDGTVTIDFDVAEVVSTNGESFTLEIARNTEAPLRTISLAAGQTGAVHLTDVTVSVGDEIHFVADNRIWNNPTGYLKNLGITLDELHWSATAAPYADPDGDGLPNLLEYALDLDPLTPDSAGAVMLGTTDNGTKLTLTFNRIADPEITYVVEATNDLASGEWEPIFASTGTENTAGPITVEDLASITDHERRFLRLVVLNGDSIVEDAPRGYQTYAAEADSTISVGVPLLRPLVLGSVVTAGDADSVTLHQGAGQTLNLANLLEDGIPYYLEITGHATDPLAPLIGARFEVSVTATRTLANNRVKIDTTSAHNTSTLSGFASLQGYRVYLRPHWTLGSLLGQGADSGLNAAANANTADRVQTWENGLFNTYYFRNSTVPEWRKTGTVNQDQTLIPPGEGFLFTRRADDWRKLVLGEVRTNRFVQPLKISGQFIASAYPLDQSPASLGLTVVNGFTAATSAANADQLLVWSDALLNTYYLRSGAPPQWRRTGTSDYTNANLIKASESAILRVKASGLEIILIPLF